MNTDLPNPRPAGLVRRALLALALSSLAALAPAQPMAAAHHDHASHGRAGCTTTDLACASAVTPFIDAQGTLWIAWSAGGAVSVARSSDGARSFGPAVVVGRHGAALDVGADARPQIVVDAAGRVIVAYGVFKDKAYNAQVLVATSLDGGASFSMPRSLSADGASQRFPALAVRDGDGALFATWLDKRTVAAARRNGGKQPGAALAYAWSRDGGRSFGVEKIAADHTCECCRLAVAFDAQHHPVVLFRSIYGTRERDHAVLTFDDAGNAGAPRRVAIDRWEIDGCPHHGPAVAVAGDGSYQAAWFTLGQLRQGLFYARSTDQGRSFSPPQAVGDPEQQPGRPYLLARGQTVWLVWKEFDGKRIFIKARRSPDAGRSWSADRVVADTGAYADHPLLVGDAQHVYLSWLTRDEGYRLIALDDR